MIIVELNIHLKYFSKPGINCSLRGKLRIHQFHLNPNTELSVQNKIKSRKNFKTKTEKCSS